MLDKLIPDDARGLYEELITEGRLAMPAGFAEDPRVRALLARGLAAATPTNPPDLAAVMPTAAFERVVIGWRRSIDQLRHAMFAMAGAAIALQERAARAARGEEALAQVVVDRAQINALVTALHASAERAIAGWSTGPFIDPEGLRATDGQAGDPRRLYLAPDDGLMATGGRARCVYDREALEVVPGALDLAAAHGEEARVLNRRLPMKLRIIDDHTVLVPLGPYGRPALVIRDRTLVALFQVFYGFVWDEADPLGPAPDTNSTGKRVDREILELMAQGLKDDAIARHCGVSTRTVRRHIAALMAELGVTTRFAAGVAVVRRGVLTRQTD